MVHSYNSGSNLTSFDSFYELEHLVTNLIADIFVVFLVYHSLYKWCGRDIFKHYSFDKPDQIAGGAIPQ